MGLPLGRRASFGSAFWPVPIVWTHVSFGYLALSPGQPAAATGLRSSPISSADLAIAQPLFTHHPDEMIEDCFSKIEPAMAPGGRFLATYFETESDFTNPKDAHDHGLFEFPRDQMENFGSSAGFRPRYIGDWQHPRQQVVVEYAKA